MLHLTDGESVAGTLREAGIPGVVATYGDLMYEGPAPAGLDEAAWCEMRARFIVEAGYATLEEARRFMNGCAETLAACAQHEEAILWLDDKLSNQLILIRVVDWLSHRNFGGGLSLVGQAPGRGLGAMTADQLAALAEIRVPVDEAQKRSARAAWRAFTSPEPTEIERWLATDSAAWPFLGAALRRQLEQFPSVDGGLSRTERQALSVLQEQGALSGSQLFRAVQRQEEPVFMGDWSFYRMMSELAAAPYPLVAVSNATRDGLGEVRITDAGRKVIEGRVDQVDLNGIDRWIGGVHLKGAQAAWRWERAAGRMIRGLPGPAE